MHCTHHPAEVCGGKVFTEMKKKYGKLVPQLTQQAATAAAAKNNTMSHLPFPSFLKRSPLSPSPSPSAPTPPPVYTVGTEIRQALVERGGGSNDAAETMGFISAEECAKKRTFLTPRAARKTYLRGKVLAGTPNIGPE